MWLNPPPLPIQATSVWVGCPWHLKTGPAYKVRGWFVVAMGSVHRFVPPTLVTSGSLAGHQTAGLGRSEPPAATGVLIKPAEPKSPELPRTVTPFSAAEMKACLNCKSDVELPNASSVEAKLCEMTLARWWSTTYCSAFIMSGKPWTPRVSAVGVVTSRMLAWGAIACDVSTSSDTSSAHALLFSCPVPLDVGGGAWVAGAPNRCSSLKVGMPAAQVTPSSPHIG